MRISSSIRLQVTTLLPSHEKEKPSKTPSKLIFFSLPFEMSYRQRSFGLAIKMNRWSFVKHSFKSHIHLIPSHFLMSLNRLVFKFISHKQAQFSSKSETMATRSQLGEINTWGNLKIPKTSDSDGTEQPKFSK